MVAALQVKVKQNVVHVDQHITKYKSMVSSLNLEVDRLKRQLSRASQAALNIPTAPGAREVIHSATVSSHREQLAKLFDEREQLLGAFVNAEVCVLCLVSYLVGRVVREQAHPCSCLVVLVEAG